jgi:hypothetical protein
MEVRLEPTWKKLLQEEFAKPYFQALSEFIHQEYKKTTVYPPPKFIFNALDSLPVDKVKVVILGQDPYHGVGQAHGLSFSVPDGVALPPSLQNIYKELQTDLGITHSSGNLENWVKKVFCYSTPLLQSGLIKLVLTKIKDGNSLPTPSAITSPKQKKISFLFCGDHMPKEKELLLIPINT